MAGILGLNLILQPPVIISVRLNRRLGHIDGEQNLLWILNTFIHDMNEDDSVKASLKQSALNITETHPSQ